MKTNIKVCAALVVLTLVAGELCAVGYAQVSIRGQRPGVGFAAARAHQNQQMAAAGYTATVSDARGPVWQTVADNVPVEAAAEPIYAGEAYVGDGYAAGGCADGSCSDYGGCGDGYCDGSCGGSCGGIHPLLGHCTTIYADYLYLRPRDAEVSYAVPIDGPITGPPANNPIQIGQVGVVDPGYNSGFRVGFGLALDTCSSIDAQFTRFQSSTGDSISTDAPDVIRSLVSHPSTVSASTDYLIANAQYDIDFDLVDVGYRHLLTTGNLYCVNYLVGTRYAKLTQSFDSLFIDNGSELVSTEVDFDGGGLKLGLEAERYSCSSGFHGYGRASASFIAGEFRADYFQGQSFDPTVVNASWQADRIVPILDLEFGIGWTGPGEQLRVNVGYMYSAWFNAVKTENFINAVQDNNFNGLDDTVTFDGLTIRTEWRF